MLAAVDRAPFPAHPARRRTEGRIHYHHRRLRVIRQHVIQLLGVLLEHPRLRVQQRQQPRPPGRQLVEDQRQPGPRRPHRQIARARRGFHEHIGRIQVRHPVRRIRQGRRGRELLELVHLLVALGLGRQLLQERVQLLDGRPRLLRRLGELRVREHIPARAIQHPVDRHLQRVIGLLRRIDALPLRPAERLIRLREQLAPGNGHAVPQPLRQVIHQRPQLRRIVLRSAG